MRTVLSMVMSLLLISVSSGIGVKGSISNVDPGILGMINNGASVYPVGQANNDAKVYLGGIKNDASILRLEFQCNLISSCGMYPYGKNNNGDSAVVNLCGVRSGANVFPGHVTIVSL